MARSEKIYELRKQLDEVGRQQIDDLMKEIDFRKEDYMRLYLEQHRSYQEYNGYSNQNAEQIHPDKYREMCDKEEQYRANEITKERIEYLEEKRMEALEKQNEKNELKIYGFLENKDAMDHDKEIDNLEKDDEKVTKIYGFLEEKDQMNDYQKDIDKNIEKEFEDRDMDYYDEY